MSKGKLFESLNEIDGSESKRNPDRLWEHIGYLQDEMGKRLQEAKESFLKIDPITDDALLDSIYDWFLKYFGEVK